MIRDNCLLLLLLPLLLQLLLLLLLQPLFVSLCDSVLY